MAPGDLKFKTLEVLFWKDPRIPSHQESLHSVH